MIVEAGAFRGLMGLGQDESATEENQDVDVAPEPEANFFDRTFMVMGYEVPQWAALLAAGAALWWLTKE